MEKQTPPTFLKKERRRSFESSTSKIRDYTNINLVANLLYDFHMSVKCQNVFKFISFRQLKTFDY